MMNDFDRAILEYRPRLRWRINLSGKWPESIEKLATEKQLPSILAKAAELPVTGIIDGIDEILHNINILKKDIGECLVSRGIDPLNTERSYIGHYADSINGSTQIEILDVLREVEEEILVLKDFFLNDLMESSSTTIQGLHELEAREISEQISNFLASPETYNPNQMALKVVCSTIAYEKLIATKGHLESIESILKATVNSPSDYSIADLTFSLLSATPKTLQELKKVSSMTFSRATKSLKNARNKKKRLSSSHIQQRALLGFKEIFLLREDTGGQIISWAKEHDLMDESSPVVSFLQEFIGVVEDFYETYDTEALDLFKIAKLDRIYREDVLRALAEKKKTRQTFQLLEAVEKEQGGALASQRFVQRHKLESETGICTDHIGVLTKPPSELPGDTLQDTEFGAPVLTGNIGLTSPGAPAAHTHGQINNAGQIGTIAGLMVRTTDNGELSTLPAGSIGTYLQYDGTWSAPPETTYSAGNGLTLSGSTFTLGTPSTLSESTTDSVYGTTHTHAIIFPTVSVPVTSVNTQTGAVLLTAADVGAAATNHNLVNTTQHPASGLTAGHFLQATGATTYDFLPHNLYKNGTSTFAGLGNARTIAHGLGTTPISVAITPSANPAGDLGEVWYTTDPTNIVVRASGSATTAFTWTAFK